MNGLFYYLGEHEKDFNMTLMSSMLPTNATEEEGFTQQSPAIANVLAVIAQLRNPQGGCPWDLKQTHATLRPYMLEEAYEAVAAMSAEPLDVFHLREELGDVLLQVLLNAQIATDNHHFTFGDVCQGLADKLVRRHPHVFGDTVSDITTPQAVTAQWQALKALEKAKQAPHDTPVDSVLAGVPQGIPALSRALAISKKAVGVGFAWPDFEALWQCVTSELAEVREVIDRQETTRRLEEELGDLLFATVNLAREYNIDPEVALTRATAKFEQRFRTMEAMATVPLEALDFAAWDALWVQAKQAVDNKTTDNDV
jgi:MazG family protein